MAKKAAPDKEKDLVAEWVRRIGAAEDVKKGWETRYRIAEGYQFWAGNQLANPFDERGDRKVQLNLIGSSVRAMLPSMYFYRPFVRIVAAPERADTPGEVVDSKAQLLQDMGNYLVREGAPGFKENTFLALKESMWAVGCVEVGYAASFTENPNVERPALKEEEWTKTDTPAPVSAEPVKDMDGLSVSPASDLSALQAELSRLRGLMEYESFYVKHIPARQILVAASDKPLIDDNDWIGYWEEYPLEDVKRSTAYKNTDDLKASSGGKDDSTPNPGRAYDSNRGKIGLVRLYKIWDLRTKTRYVIAQNHESYLLKESYKRLPLKFLRPDIDPVHFFPKPPVFNGLMPQEEYNDSREHLRKLRKGTVPLYTVSDDVEDSEMQKLETGVIGGYIRRKQNSANPIEPVMQPNYAENALQTLSISEKEFNTIMGVPAEYRQSQEQKTATQAMIQNTQAQVQDSFDRAMVAEWLASVSEELILLAVENLNVDRWIGVNVDPDSMFAPQESMAVADLHQKITSEKLASATNGIRWHVQVDVESLSPVSEDQKFARWMQALTLITNPAIGRLLAFSPPVLKRTMDLLGLKNGREQDAIREALTQMVQMEMAMAQANAGGGSAPKTPGMASQPAAPSPGSSPSPPPSLPEPPPPPGPAVGAR